MPTKDRNRNGEAPWKEQDRPRIAGLIQRGATPQKLQEAMKDESMLAGLKRFANITDADVTELAERWPIRTGGGTT